MVDAGGSMRSDVDGMNIVRCSQQQRADAQRALDGH